MKGVAPVKSCYLVSTVKNSFATPETDKAIPICDDDKAQVEQADAPPKKKKRKGQNKQREKFSNHRVAPEHRLCKAILCDTECSYGSSCKFSHDVTDFMSKKPVDLTGVCYNFSQLGRCPYGFACRFAKSHISEVDGKFTNMVNDSVVPASTSVNSLSKANLALLRKHQYDFSKAMEATKSAHALVDIVVKRNLELNCTKKNKAVDSVNCNTKAVEENRSSAAIDVSAETEKASPLVVDDGVDNTIASIQQSPVSTDTQVAVATSISKDEETVVATATECQPIGPITNEDQFAVQPGEKKTIDFKNKLYLAPLTTVGNLPFRRVCKTYGADITCGEMALATKILQGVNSEWALLKRHCSEDLFGVQVCGAFADSMAKCTQLITETCDIDFIDINVGCPIDLIFDQGAGSALMRRVNRFHEIVQSMVQVSSVPITVKIRTGISETKNTAHTLIPKLRDWGVALTTMHGRSREQRYTKMADWAYIDECAQLAAPMPLCGGGDIFSFEDYNEAIKSNVSGTMLARGALIKPWLFTEIKEQRHWDISSSERLDILKDFSNYGLEHWGSDQQGVETTRRFMLEWLSFLHRYIPVGLLERLPQKINERPLPYFGRNDLETLMASPNSADWVKISEMLLGPVPEGFFFIPKHRANSYA